MSETLFQSDILATRQALSLGGENQAQSANIAAARQAAEDFEAVFLSQMLSHMFAGVETGGPFGGGHAEEVFQSVMVDEYGKMMARSGGVGLADSVMNEILRMQESQE